MKFTGTLAVLIMLVCLNPGKTSFMSEMVVLYGSGRMKGILVKPPSVPTCQAHMKNKGIWEGPPWKCLSPLPMSYASSFDIWVTVDQVLFD